MPEHFVLDLGAGTEQTISGTVQAFVEACTFWVLSSSHFYWPELLSNALTRNNVNQNNMYDRRLSTLLHNQVHWLNIPKRVEYKLAVMVRRCLENKAPRHLVDCCTPVADVASWHRRSANLNRLNVQGVRQSGTHCLSCRTAWADCQLWWLSSHVKTILFARY